MNKEIKQILPNFFEDEVRTKKALCVTVEKKKTGMLVDFLKKEGLSEKFVYLKNDNDGIVDEDNYLYGKFNDNRKLTEDRQYYNIDLSFIKMVKPLDEKRNNILITFLDVSIHFI
jgi:hypothetical protein